jgi:hypothetical protein
VLWLRQQTLLLALCMLRSVAHLGAQGDTDHSGQLVSTSLHLLQCLHVLVEVQVLRRAHNMGPPVDVPLWQPGSRQQQQQQDKNRRAELAKQNAWWLEHHLYTLQAQCALQEAMAAVQYAEEHSGDSIREKAAVDR